MSGLIYKKMASVMQEIGPVTKDQKNIAQGFKFRGIDQFVNALHPALVKHGVFMAPRATSYTQELKEVQRSSGKNGIDKHVSIMMEYDFFAEDGSKVTIGPIPAEGLDSGDKATNKALSAALKYALIQTFAVPTEDMEEADKTSPEINSFTKTKPTAKQEEPTSITVINGIGTVGKVTLDTTLSGPNTPATPVSSPKSGFASFKANGSAGPAKTSNGIF